MIRLLTILSAMAVALLSGSAWAVADSSTAARLVEQARATLISNPKEASSLANRAMKLSDLSRPDSICREATILYGDAEQLLGNFDLSLRILSDAEQMADKSDTRTMARILVLQGRVFSKLGDYARSTELNDRATSMFRVLGDSTSVANCFTERGVMLLNTDQFVLAEHFFRRALDINRRLHDLRNIAVNLNNMCLYPGDSEEKLQMIEEAITINRNLGAIWALGENYNNKAKQLCYAGRPKEALKALETAYQYISQLGAKELLCDYWEYRAMASSAAGDNKDAYESMEKMVSLVRELQRSHNQRNTEIEISRKRADDQRQAAERQENEYRISLLHRNLWILASGAILLVVCALFYYKRYRHNKNIQILQAEHNLAVAEKEVDKLKLRQQELELENAQTMISSSRQELTGFAAFLKSRNELMDRIREMLREGYKLEPSMLPAHLKKISAFIKTYAGNDQTSQMLLLKAEERNKVFLDRLLAKHPDLTKGERNLALLIRGGLSSKEISMLLNLEPKTVNMNRYRLRKALSLDSDTDLYEYLLHL